MAGIRREPTADGARVVELGVSLFEAEVHRLLGYPEDRAPGPSTQKVIEAVLGEARGLLRARGAWRAFPPERAGELLLEEQEGASLAIGIVTVGEALEARARELLDAGEPTEAMIFDAAGSAAAEEAADQLSALISTGEPASTRGAIDPPCRLSPGYGGWPLEAQRALFAALPHEELGVRLVDSLMMVPRKSVSFAMWLGSSRSPRSGEQPCHRCQMKKCPYRRGRRANASARKEEELLP